VSEKSGKMTKLDLYDWVRTQGCNIEPLPEHKAKVLNVINPKTGANRYLYLPIDERPVNDFTVMKTCCDLGIPFPTYTKYMKPLHDEINDKHIARKKK